MVNRNAPSVAPSTSPEPPATLADVQEQVRKLKEGEIAVSQQSLDTLRANVAALPEDERNRMTDDVRELLKELKTGPELQANLIALETRLEDISKGNVESALEGVGGFAGRQGDALAGEVGRTFSNSGAAVGELYRNATSSKAAMVLSVLGLVGFAMAVNKARKSGGWKSKVLKYTGLALVAGIILNVAGRQAVAREQSQEVQTQQDRTIAEAFRTDAGNNPISLFGNDALSQRLASEQVDLTELGLPVQVGGHSLQFETAAAGNEVLWAIDNKKFRVFKGRSVGTAGTRPNISGNLMSVSRVPNSDLLKFRRASGDEFHMTQQTLETVVGVLSGTTGNSSQSVQIIENAAEPQNTTTMSLEFELVTSTTPPPSTGGSTGGTATTGTSTS